jgi:hypothetical protein
LGPNTGINPRGLKENHIWQTDVTHIPQFATLKYVHVTVEKFSGSLFSSAYTLEVTKHALGHQLGAFANFAMPKSIRQTVVPLIEVKNFKNSVKYRT